MGLLTLFLVSVKIMTHLERNEQLRISQEIAKIVEKSYQNQTDSFETKENLKVDLDENLEMTSSQAVAFSAQYLVYLILVL